MVIVICPGGLLSPSPYMITKNLFPPRWDQVFLFTPNGVLILFERRKKLSTIGKETKTRCNL